MDNRFSRLPDDLLIRILLFAPIKDAVATSILSKRWRSLWRLLPRLNFADDCVNGRRRVLSSDFIFGTLLLNKSPVLESFHLTKDSECSPLHIELWVRFALEHHLRDLKISYYYEFDSCVLRLPARLFRSETIESLQLQKVTLFEIPSPVSLPSLKTLRLLSVTYPDQESFIRLISSSHVLENLAVETCTDDNVDTFTINVPSLQSLSVCNIPQGTGPNYTNLFVIHPHSLKRLDIVEEYGGVIFIGDMPELVEARLLNFDSKGNALKSLTSVKRLSLSLDYRAQYPIGTIFFRLARLEFRGFGMNWWDLLVHVLQHSPVLQILKFEDDLENEWQTETDKGCWIQPSRAPECLLYRLKTFEWRDYQGKRVEKEVAIYILKNARQLVTATVCNGQFKKVDKQAFEELELATRGSRACELTMC